jgi:hypothetical protein
MEADKGACDVTVPVALAYRLSTGEVTLSDTNNNLHGLNRLKHRQRLRKVWHETKDPSCKIEVGLVTKSDE